MGFDRPLTAFYSYAHKNGKDRKHLEELRDAVAFMRIEGELDDWDDSEIRAGEDWEELLLERAKKARLFILILTNKFIGSKYCVFTELVIARKLRESRMAAIAPVLAEEANWQIQSLKDIQVIMPFGKPVSASKRSAAWTEVGKAIKKMVDALADGTYFQAAEPPPIPPLLPYTIGRTDLAEDHAKAVSRAPAGPPLVCILSGEGQGQLEFIEYLLSDEGPVRRLLAISGAIRMIELTAGDWGSPQPIELLLNDAIASQLEPPPEEVDRKAIAQRLPGSAGLTVVRCQISAREWGLYGEARLLEFVRYWSQWPNAQSAERIVVLVAILADVPKIAATDALCIALPDVSQADVLAWTKTAAAQRRFLTDRIEANLGEIFKERDHLTMDEFVRRATPLLRRLQI